MTSAVRDAIRLTQINFTANGRYAVDLRVPHHDDRGGTCAPQADGVVEVAMLTASVLYHGLGVGGLGALILAMAGLPPLGLLDVTAGTTPAAAVVDLVLVFGLQHSVMARPAFKRAFARHLAPALERSAFVLASGLALALVVVAWQPLGCGTAWQLDGVAGLAAWAGFVFGWCYLLAATVAINHFDLFGLREAWFAARGRAYELVRFVEHWMYRYSRHPLRLGVLIGLWCLPHRTWTRAGSPLA